MILPPVVLFFPKRLLPSASCKSKLYTVSFTRVVLKLLGNSLASISCAISLTSVASVPAIALSTFVSICILVLAVTSTSAEVVVSKFLSVSAEIVALDVSVSFVALTSCLVCAELCVQVYTVIPFSSFPPSQLCALPSYVLVYSYSAFPHEQVYLISPGSVQFASFSIVDV